MKDLFIALSNYNKNTNSIIYAHIKKMNSEQLGRAIESYYSNIGETIVHVLRSDIKWLERLAAFKTSAIETNSLPAFLSDEKASCDKIAAEISSLSDLRTRVDNAIIELIAAIPAETFPKMAEIQFGQNKLQTELWKMLLQWFNHHTHHRGQISLQLDLLGIPNDYSLILDKI